MFTFDPNKKGTNFSRFWLGENYFSNSPYNTKQERESEDIVKLASIKRSIGNFVRIVTNQNIPVKFKIQGLSCTDGENVIISSDLKNFDATCGLALHEGSHIKLSDFNLMKQVVNDPTKFFDKKFRDKINKKYNFKTFNELEKYLSPHLKTLLNWVEDRRIDYYIYKNAPGYRGYYESMYDEYFNNKIIDKSLKSADFRDENWNSYDFRIINLTNPKRDLNALKGLKKIWNIIDFKNIERLKDSKDSLEIAIKVFEVIEKYIHDPSIKKEEQKGEKEFKSGEGNGDGEELTQEDIENLTEKELESLLDAIKKQKDFINGDVKKKQVSDDVNIKLHSLDQAGVEEKQVAKDQKEILYNKTGSCPVTIVNNFNKALIDSDPFRIFPNTPRFENEINEGIILGKLLGRKLQIRNEERTLKCSRLRNGKIDDRLIHSIGFDSEQIFEKTYIDNFNPVHLHISIDGSGSMSGSKWSKTQKAVVAIAKAASMVSNLNVVISYRYTYSIGNSGSYSSCLPLVLIAYDSKKDNFNKIKNLFPYLVTTGTTPEGLCYEAIRNIIISGRQNLDSYFINFSDGMPSFENDKIRYTGYGAYEHTRKEINIMKDRGVKILAYFIDTGGYWGNSLNDFKKMYGKDSKNVDVNSITELARTLNNRFVTK